MVALQWADVWQTQEAAKHQPPLWRLAPRVGQEITVAFFVDLPTREARELKSLRADLLYYFRLGLTECENHNRPLEALGIKRPHFQKSLNGFALSSE